MNLAVTRAKLIGWIAIAIIACCNAGMTMGQADDLSSKSLEELKSSWNDCKTSMTEKAAAFKEAGPTEQDKLRTEYTALVDQGNKIIDALKTAVLAKIKEKPTNRDNIQTILGIMVNDARFERDGEVMKVGQQLIDAKINPAYFEYVSKQTLPIPTREMFEELVIRQRDAASDNLPRVELTTSQGPIVIELYENEAPNTVANFISLVEKNFYDGLKFHRVIDGFMAQGGRPEGDIGGPGYEIPCECFSPEARRHYSWTLSMAHRGKDTGGSQFFLTFDRQSGLDGRHTVFGRVISGFDVLDKLTRTHTTNQLTGADQPIEGATPDIIKTAKVLRKRDHEYTPKKVGDPEEPVEPPTTQPDKELQKSGDDKSNSKESDDGKSEDGGGDQ